MKFKIPFVLALILMSLSAGAQTNNPFQLYLEPMNVPQLGGLQAFAFGQSGGKWIVIGGRLDGLHRRQPFAAFDVAGNNNQLIVVDPVAKQKWSVGLNSLPVAIQEQLSSTNMQFHQQGDYLYLLGGYGYNAATASRLTFPGLIAIHVPALINSIVAGTSITGHFRQITDQKFAVTGGHLKKINQTYYLVGGNRFDGNYNPMGNPTYTQVYTNAIRKFTLVDDGSIITITHLPEIYDAINLHRRDYNVVPQILPNGAEGITAFSGVFQPTVDLPFLNSVNIDSTSHQVNQNFQQYYNHYHCAVLPAYSKSKNEMHNVFFGGIAQFYDSAGVLVQDNNVPFVKTIARVSRTANGNMAEYKLPVEMPGLLGAGSEFIPLPQIPQFANEVIDLDALQLDTTMVGYIYGGISSTAPNIFFTNTGAQSSASSQIYKVFLTRSNLTSIPHQLNTQSMGSMNLQLYPNPNEGEFVLKFYLPQVLETKLSVYSLDGKLLESEVLPNLKKGENSVNLKFNELGKGLTYLITIENNLEKITRKLIIQP